MAYYNQRQPSRYRVLTIAETPTFTRRDPVKEELFEELLGSVREAGAILRGERKPSRSFSFEDPDVAEIRDAYGLSQSQFASLLGISVRTLQNWEQGRRRPEGPARVLLQVAAAHPEAVLDTVRRRAVAAEKAGSEEP